MCRDIYPAGILVSKVKGLHFCMHNVCTCGACVGLCDFHAYIIW